MWHEARKTEKQVYKLFDTSQKKKEIARRIQEQQHLKEVDNGLTVYGHKMRIYDDVDQETRATSSALTKWQGDETVMIDRFDVRNFLETIPRKPKLEGQVSSSADEYIEEIKVEYERYKELVANEFTGESEDYLLSQVEERDVKKAKLRLQKQQQRSKKHVPPQKGPPKPTNKKATVGFTYEDSNNGDDAEEDAKDESEGGEKEVNFIKPDSGSEGSDDEEDELFCDRVSSIVFSSNDWERLNRIAEKYHVPKDAFDKLFDVDRCDELDTAKIHEIERERLSISGRGGKRARAKLQYRKNLILKDPLNEDAVHALRRFAERKMKAEMSDESEESSDESEFEEKVEFITSFGGEDESPKKKKTKLAPTNSVGDQVLEAKIIDQRKLAQLKNRRSESPFGDDWAKPGPSTALKREPSVKEPVKTRSRSKSPRKTRRRSRSRSRPRSPSPKQRRRRSSSRSASPPVRRPSKGGWLRDKIKSLEKQKQHGQQQDANPAVPSDVDTKLEDAGSGNVDDDVNLEIRSSMSESEKEKIQIENTKRRLRRTKRELEKRAHLRKPEVTDDSDEKNAAASQNLKLKLQKDLSRTRKELEQDDKEKQAQKKDDIKNRHEGDYTARKYTTRRTPHRSDSSETSTDDESRRRRRRSRSPRRSRRDRSRSRSRSPRRHYSSSRRHSRSSDRRRDNRKRSRSRSRDRR